MGQLFTFTGLQTLKKTLSYAKRGGDLILIRCLHPSCLLYIPLKTPHVEFAQLTRLTALLVSLFSVGVNFISCWNPDCMN